MDFSRFAKDKIEPKHFTWLGFKLVDGAYKKDGFDGEIQFFNDSWWFCQYNKAIKKIEVNEDIDNIYLAQTQAAKRTAFLKKAAENEANQSLHKQLIAETLENWHGLEKASIEYFAQSGKVSGSFFLALMTYAEKYHEARKNADQ